MKSWMWSSGRFFSLVQELISDLFLVLAFHRCFRSICNLIFDRLLQWFHHLLNFTWTPSCLLIQCVSCASTPQRNVSFLLPASSPPLHSPPTRSSCPSSPPLTTLIWVQLVWIVVTCCACPCVIDVCVYRRQSMREDRNMQRLACRNKTERHTMISVH